MITLESARRYLVALRPYLRQYLALFIGWIVLFVVAKIAFMIFYRELYAGCGFGELCSVLVHGLRLDMAMSGYLSAVPALFLIAQPWIRQVRVAGLCVRIYLAVMIPLVVLILLTDMALYGYWDFKLDITPLYYFISSPSSAMASTSGWVVAGGVILWVTVSYCLWWLFVRMLGLRRLSPATSCRATASVVMFLLAALLFIPIRGGFGVASINLSSAFFSNNMRLNHAAVNPVFSLLYSAVHQQHFDRMFRFLPPGTAAEIFLAHSDTIPYAESDSLINTPRPDIYIIILESFSTHLMPSMGGIPVATSLDSIAGSGLLFTNAYASSFRTDRGLPAILNGFPAQPNTSLMKYPEKTRHIPSLASSLADEGYVNRFYYGGDASFANQMSYLLNTGFTNIVTQDDFPKSYRSAKWGVTDNRLFDKALSDALSSASSHPTFTVIQTLSSHEPFDVPYTDPVFADNPPLNAFRFTDNAMAGFVNGLRDSERWDDALIILVPDHYGCYPPLSDPMDVEMRHHIPIVMTGGALNMFGRIDTPVSQVDIASTLLDALGIERSAYDFGRNMLNPSAGHFAYCSTPSYVALVDSGGVASVYNVESDQFVTTDGTTAPDSLLQAYVQSLYDRLGAL